MKSSRLFLAITILALAALACNTFFPPRPPIAWDTDPNTIIIEATFGGGMVPVNAAQNQIADARVWGDGRMVWTQFDSQNHRRVFETQVSDDVLRAYFQRAEDAGFFGWDDFYTDGVIYDAATKCLRLNLQSVTKGVCEYAVGAPPALHTLYSEVSNGLGQQGHDYQPTTGYLIAYPQNYSGSTPTVILVWPAKQFGVSLKDAVAGKWLEGEALETAWLAVNVDPWGGVVQEGDTYYALVLQVPGISQIEPPAP